MTALANSYSGTAPQLPALNQSLPQTQSDWQQVLNQLGTWSQSIQQTAGFTSIGDLYNITPAETAAGLISANLTFGFNPGDVRRYAASGTYGQGADDSAAWQAMFNVGTAGCGTLFAPAGPTLVNKAVTIARGGNWTLSATGCVVTRGTGVTGSLFIFNTGSLNSRITLRGFGGTDAQFNNQPFMLFAFAINTSVLDCIFSNVYIPIQFDNQTVGNDGTGSILQNVERCIFFNTAGSYGIILKGASNATNVRGCSFINTNVAGVYVIPDSGQTTLSDSTNIESNWFQGSGSMAAGVLVQHSTAAGCLGIFGFRGVFNRFENMTNAYAFAGVPGGGDSNLPPVLFGNTYVSGVNPLNNTAGITVNQYDIGTTPQVSPSLSSYYGFLFQSLENSFVFNAGFGQGYVLQNIADLTKYFEAILKPGGGALVDLPSGGIYKISGTQVLGPQITGYGTPTGGSHQASFAAGAITLPNLAAAVAQLIVDLKTHGLIGA